MEASSGGARPSPGSTPAEPLRPGRGSRARRSGGASAYPAAVERLIEALAQLPGIGRRSAERCAFFLLKGGEELPAELAEAVRQARASVRSCSICWNLTSRDPCPICAAAAEGVPDAGNPAIRGGRDCSMVMVVEEPRDLAALEGTGMYRGLYHCLMGHISPLDGVGPGELTVPALVRRLEDPGCNPGGVAVREVVLALNPTLEGDGTALYLAEELTRPGVRVTRLARGLPAGSPLEYASKAVLADAIQGRHDLK